MWYVFVVLGGYVAASIFYQKVSRRFEQPSASALWCAYGLLAWSLAGFVWQFGLERGIPFFFTVVALAGPCALVLEYVLKDSWKKSVTLCAGLAAAFGVMSTVGALL